ncbi:hypothetical protein KC19_VG124100 [Ceratodon purpureus]|uniref:Uncharacterized protein n=1 Tax=Ceratodon purpureus TaxID=3225 RepID=A0A8T0HPQ1_CERPU|nr:hypothetical protein KC19_VG124100 [Ceratodon purpureus]
MVDADAPAEEINSSPWTRSAGRSYIASSSESSYISGVISKGVPPCERGESGYCVLHLFPAIHSAWTSSSAFLLRVISSNSFLRSIRYPSFRTALNPSKPPWAARFSNSSWTDPYASPTSWDAVTGICSCISVPVSTGNSSDSRCDLGDVFSAAMSVSVLSSSKSSHSSLSLWSSIRRAPFGKPTNNAMRQCRPVPWTDYAGSENGIR